MRMIIVDDDVQIREGMRDGIDWEDIGIDSVECFGNVQEAVKDMRIQRPDIVITDIRMPGMSGIEFLELIHKEDESIQVILVSGYADFKYAQEGIKYGAKEYILKPIKVREIIRTVQNIVEELQKRRQTTLEQEKALTASREKFLREFFLGKIQDRNIIKENIARYYQIDLGNYILCTVIRCSTEEEAEDETRDENWFIKNIKAGGNREYLIYRAERGEIFLICAAENSAIYNMNLKYSLLQEALNAGAKVAGISETHAIEETGKAYLEALKCLEIAFIKGEGGGYIYQEQMFSGRSPISKEKIQHKLADFLERGEEDDCYQWFDQMINDLVNRCITDKDDIVQFICESAIYIKGRMTLEGEYFPEISSEKIREELRSAVSLKECACIWKNVIGRFFQCQRGRNIDDYPSDIREAIRFVYEHYKDRISARTVADHVGKSENYFRSYFKNITGTALKDFINHYRIEQAERLLRHSNMYVYEIGEAVGFQDYAYFAKIFKKIKGHSPASVRKAEE